MYDLSPAQPWIGVLSSRTRLLYCPSPCRILAVFDKTLPRATPLVPALRKSQGRFGTTSVGPQKVRNVSHLSR